MSEDAIHCIYGASCRLGKLAWRLFSFLMNSPLERTIICPKCGGLQTFAALESINATLNPELKSQLLDGSLMRAVCKQCGGAAEVLYPFLYHDMQKHLLFWLWQEPADPADPASLHVADRMSDYKLRLVSSRNALVEKILIFDEGLDDRVIEIVKLLLQVQSSQSVHPVTADLLFISPPEGAAPETIFFDHFNNGQSETLSVPLKVYQRVAEALATDLAKPQCDKWLRVDVEYAQTLALRLNPGNRN